MCHILPKNSEGFRCKNYWDEFYNSYNSSFEWYGSIKEIKKFLENELFNLSIILCKPIDELKILNLGCGNSLLFKELSHTFGCYDIVNMDFSDYLTTMMRRKFSNYKWVTCDARYELLTKFNEESFEVMIDKAFLDSYLANDAIANKSFDVSSEAQKLLNNLLQLLCYNGLYIFLSLMEPNIVTGICKFIFNLAKSKIRTSYILRIYPYKTPESSSAFLCVIMKVNESYKLPIDFDLVLNSDGCLISEKYSLTYLTKVISVYREFMFEDLHVPYLPGKRRIFKIYDNQDANSLIVIDTFIKGSIPTAAMIVTKNQSEQWLFISEEGNEELASQCQCRRLLLIFSTFNIIPHYVEDKQSIRSIIDQYAITSEVATPLLTVSDDKKISKCLEQIESSIAGKISVFEDIADETIHRCMYFDDCPNLIQSELYLNIQDKSINYEKTISGYYKALLFAIQFSPTLANNESQKFLVFGIGGGVFLHVISNYMESINKCYSIMAVDFNTTVLDFARKYFYLSDNKLKNTSIEIEDAFKFISKAPDYNLYNNIILDINSNDKKDAITSPPAILFKSNYLEKLKTLLFDNGLLILNVLTRSNKALNELKESLKKYFPTCLSIETENLNKIVVCIKLSQEINVEKVKTNILINLKLLV